MSLPVTTKPPRETAHTQRRAAQRMAAALFGCLAPLAACAQTQDWSSTLPSPDGKQFAAEVYPLLLRDCAFSTCHGAPERFLQIYGPGRVRLDPIASKPADPMTLAEVLHSYQRARSMLTDGGPVQQSLLLRKPLALEAGGQAHRGADDFGRNLFSSQSDPRYLALLGWAESQGLQPTAADVAAAAALSTR
jgi:hypothetical protein